MYLRIEKASAPYHFKSASLLGWPRIADVERPCAFMTRVALTIAYIEAVHRLVKYRDGQGFALGARGKMRDTPGFVPRTKVLRFFDRCLTLSKAHNGRRHREGLP